MNQPITDAELVEMRMDDDGSPVVTIRSTEQDEHFDYVLTTTVRDDLATLSRTEVEEKARYWFGIATEMKSIQDQLAADLETALNACRDYQRDRAENETPDPSFVAVRNLLTKYKMDYTPPAATARVYADGVDITEHPDSLPGEVVDWAFDGVEAIELVQDETGAMHFRPVVRPPLPQHVEDNGLHNSPEDPSPIFEEAQGPHTPTPEEIERFFAEVAESLTTDDPDVYLGDHDRS